MTYDEIRADLAPCGLSCAKCMVYAEGDIKRHAMELSRLLGNFDAAAARLSRFAPVFGNWPAFKELLSYFTGTTCRGCRSGECIFPTCGVKSCYLTRGVDFCSQCAEFPCKNSGFAGEMEERWLARVGRMKEVGVEAFWEETKDQPRYG
jgi:hypothetical protein